MASFTGGIADSAAKAQASVGTAKASAHAAKFAQKKAGKGVPLHALFEHIGGAQARAARLSAMGYVLESLVTHARINGPYGNPTGNLRRSLTWEIMQNKKDETVGVFANTAYYAVFVEYKPNFWVLSGSIKALRPLISDMIGTKIKQFNPPKGGVQDMIKK